MRRLILLATSAVLLAAFASRASAQEGGIAGGVPAAEQNGRARELAP
jgi:hypothetical protein